VEIPKGGGKMRRDRVAQEALKLVLEPIFEADFQPGSFGYWPKKHVALRALVVGSGFNSAVRDGDSYLVTILGDSAEQAKHAGDEENQ
jgi:hypothetical protein